MFITLHYIAGVLLMRDHPTRTRSPGPRQQQHCRLHCSRRDSRDYGLLLALGSLETVTPRRRRIRALSTIHSNLRYFGCPSWRRDRQEVMGTASSSQHVKGYFFITAIVMICHR